MVNFGKKIVDAQYVPWRQHYIDYNFLKNLLENRKTAGTPTSVVDDDSLVIKRSDSLAFEVTDEAFRCGLDHEIEAAVLFFLEKQGELASRLTALGDKKSKLEQCVSNDPSQIDDLIEEYTSVGQDLLRLVQFTELNVTAVRKILKKHDKLFKSNKLSKRYLSRYVDGSDSHLNQLYHYGGISALVATMQPAFAELRRFERAFLKGQHYDGVANGQHMRRLSDSYQVSTHNRTKSNPFELSGHAENQVYPLVEGPIDQDELPLDFEEPIIFRINLARKHLEQSTHYVEVLAAQALMFEREESLEYEDEKVIEKTRRQKISSFLNLLSTFLYMTNYYIVAPTSGMYAEKLGSSEALSGVIIGMTPIAALVASFLYGWWSNHSYKSALLFAAMCSLVGDVLYALALPYSSLNMVIAGRYLNGFGSARAINRRYIADTFNRRERTAASAAFVTAGALGMAVGPGIAAVLGQLSPMGNIWTIETAPGWVMFVLWSLFFVAMLFFFEEPERNIPVVRQELELVSEKSALVKTEQSLGKSQSFGSLPPLWKNVPVMMSLWIYFVLKLVLECLLSSTATLTKFYFGWGTSLSGVYLSILGLLMFPANLVVAGLSDRFDDREIMMATLLMMTFGLIGIVCYWKEPYTAVQYIFFSICIFLSTNALEGPNMSLLSKTIPRAWAKGTFNSGLLATEAGTFGRAVGDVFITAISLAGGISFLLDGTFVPLGILVIATTAITRKLYVYLEPADDDDDD